MWYRNVGHVSVNRVVLQLGSSPSRYPVDWGVIAADPVFRGDLYTHWIVVGARIDTNEDLTEASQALARLIETELRR